MRLAVRRWAVVVVGLVVAVGLPAGWALSRPPAEVGQTAASVAPARIVPPAPAPVPSPAPSAHGPGPGPAETVAARPSVRAADLRPSPVVVPVRLRVPAIGVDAAVEPVGVEAGGEMEVPGEVATVGWYRPGPAPGDEQGTAVLAGHVDSRVAGRGAFFHLERSEPGDEVLVTLADGRERRYQVVGRRRYDKAALPAAEIFATSGAPRLALITCGGAFEAASRRYVDNVVVYAVPV